MPGFAVAIVSDITGFPEMMDGRVKDAAPSAARRHPGSPRSA
jgi:AICAR transformylase/IMP cyclohydrolase PurH